MSGPGRIPEPMCPQGTAYCAPCTRESEQERRQARKRAAYHADPSSGWRAQGIQGMTIERYEQMLSDQDGHCALCPRTPEDEGRRLPVDHDPETGEPRGLLCTPCNSGIGHLGDDPGRLLDAWAYLTAASSTTIPAAVAAAEKE